MTEAALEQRGNKSASHWVRRTVTVAFCLILLSTLGLAFTRVIAARVPEQRATLEKLITDRTGLEVRFENVRFGWGLDGTSAVFTRVQLTDPKAGRVRVVAPELRVALDTWDLVRHQRFSLGHVTLASPDIEIIGDAEQGMASNAPQGAAGDRQLPKPDEAALLRRYLSWAELMPVGRIEVEGARVHLKRRGPSGTTTGSSSQDFTLSEAVISRGSSTFNAYGTMLLSQDMGQSLFVSARLDGLAAGARVSGDLRLVARRIFLDRLPVAGFTGRGTIDTRLQLRDGLVASGSWQASARDLQLNGEGGAHFDHVNLNGRMSREAGDILLDFTDLQLTQGARLERAPAFGARLQLDPDSLQLVRGTVRAGRLPFLAAQFAAGLMQPRLAQALPISTGWTVSAGELRDVVFESSGPYGATGAWTLSAQIADSELSRDRDQARINGLSASIHADSHGFRLKFDPANEAELHLEQQQTRAVSLAGELAVDASSFPMTWRFQSFVARHGVSAVTVDGGWGSAATRNEPLNLTLEQVDRGSLQDAWTLLASTTAAPAVWSDVQQATIVQGRLTLLPADDGTVSWGRSNGLLKLADLATSGQGTPRLAGGGGALSFARGAAQLKLDAGSVEDLTLNVAQLDWPRRGAPRLHVALEGNLQSPIIRDVLRAQGLERLGGAVALEADARGERVLREPALWRMTAKVRAATVPIGAGLPPAENLAGTIRYSARQLRALELKGNWLGGTIEIESRRSPGQGPLAFSLHGVADSAPLLGLLGQQQAAQHVSGQVAWSGSAEPGAETGSWQLALASNLAGIESRLPQPFGKSRMRSLPVSARLNIAADGIREFAIDGANLSLHGQVRDEMLLAKFSADGIAGEFRRPTRSDARSELQIDTLDLRRAPAILAAAGALLPANAEIALNIDELRYGDSSLGALQAALDRQESGLTFSMESPADALHRLAVHGQCDANGRCGAEFSADTAHLAALLRGLQLPPELPIAELHVNGTLDWPADPDTDFTRALTGKFNLETEGEPDHQLAGRGTITNGEILLADLQGTGPAADQVFRGSGRIGLAARDYDLTMDYERVVLAAAAVPSPARARLARAWNAVRGSVPETKRVQWHGTWQ